MMYEIAIIQFSKMLKNLEHILGVGAQFADAKKFEVDVLLHSRLAPDQFPLIRQVQIACDTAKLGASRLTGMEAPSHDDKEKTLPELKKRIEETLHYLSTFKPEDFNGATERKITTPRWEGKTLTGEQYLIQHMLPNLYFHITTAYSILRESGVDVGKKHYIGELPFKA